MPLFLAKSPQDIGVEPRFLRPLPDDPPGAGGLEGCLFARSRRVVGALEGQRSPGGMLRLLVAAVQGLVVEAAARCDHRSLSLTLAWVWWCWKPCAERDDVGAMFVRGRCVDWGMSAWWVWCSAVVTHPPVVIPSDSPLSWRTTVLVPPCLPGRSLALHFPLPIILFLPCTVEGREREHPCIVSSMSVVYLQVPW